MGGGLGMGGIACEIGQFVRVGFHVEELRRVELAVIVFPAALADRDERRVGAFRRIFDAHG